MNYQYEDALDAFLLKRMTQEEKELFLNEVNVDENLSKELVLHQEMFDGITAIGDKQKRDEIATIKVNDEDCMPYVEEEVSYDKRKKRSIFQYLALAASIILLAGISFILLNQTENNYSVLANRFYTKYTEQDRGEPIKIDDQTDGPKKMLLSGIEYYEEKKYKQAISQFEVLIAKNDMLYMIDSKWYASLSYLQMAKPDRAKILLQEILNDAHAGKKNRQRAKEVLNDIDKIQADK